MRTTVSRGPARLVFALALALVPTTAMAWGNGQKGRGTTDARAEQLLRSRLGAEVTPMLPEVADCLGLERGSGVVVGDVEPNGPAAQAGLRPGDVVTGAGEEELLQGPRALSQVVRRQPRGEPLAMQVIRDGQPLDLEVVPRAAPVPARTGGGGSAVGGGPAEQAIVVARLGAAVVDARGGGARVESVEPMFPSPMLQPGDVVVELDGTRVTSAEDLANAASNAPEDTPLALSVRRGGRVIPMGIKLGGPPAGGIGGGPAPSSRPPETGAPPGH